MKFLCDNCKAKYQIADEKVAGKTVRMKCRKCGHQIEVRAAVTEGTGSIPPPAAAPLPGVRPPPRPAGGGLATSLSAQKPKAPAAPAGALAGAFAKNVNDAPASSASAAPAGGASIELSVSDEWYVAINGVPVGPVRISELRRKAATGAVNEDSLCWQEGLEEWRPIKSIPELAQLVREAASGNRPSLVDSSPAPGRISTYPSASKTAAAPAARPSTIPPAPAHTAAFGTPSPGVLSNAPSAPMPVAAPTAPMASPMAPRVTPLAPAARSNVVPLRPSATPASPSMDDLPLGPFGGTGSGSAAAAFAPSPTAPASSPALPVADPFAVPAPAPFSLSPAMPPAGSMTPLTGPVMGSAPSFGDGRISTPSFVPSPAQPSYAGISSPAAPVPMSAVPAREKKGTPLWFWPILVLFLGFGGGAAYFVFAKQQPVVIQVPAPAPAPAPTPAPTPADSLATIEVPPPEPVAQNETTPGVKKPAGGGAKKPAAPAAEPQKGLDLGGLGGGVGGPNVGPGPGGGGGSGGGLDQSGVERVVSAHRAGVKRTCWERGGADQKSSVNVNVQATVAPNGTVSGVTSSGDDPVVGKCIENQVRSWTFPAPGSTTQINIPFKFVRQ